MILKNALIVMLLMVNQCLAQTTEHDVNDTLPGKGLFLFVQNFTRFINVASLKKVAIDSADRHSERNYNIVMNDWRTSIIESVYHYDRYAVEIKEYYTQIGVMSPGYSNDVKYIRKNNLRNYISIRGQKFYHDSIYGEELDYLPINSELTLDNYLSLPSGEYLLGIVHYQLYHYTSFTKMYAYVIFDIRNGRVINIPAPSLTFCPSDGPMDDFNGDGILDFLALDEDKGKICFWTLQNQSFVKDDRFFIKVEILEPHVAYRINLKDSQWFKEIDFLDIEDD